MKNKETIVTMSIDMYLSALSSRKMRNQLSRHFQTQTSHVTILDWVRKYVLRAHKYVDALKPTISGKCYADETIIDRNACKDRFWACVDHETRFINAIHYSISGNEEEAEEFLHKVSKHSLPHYVQTDAAQFYPRAFMKAFYSNKLQGLKVEHRINNVSKSKVHNVRIETVFSKVKDRVRNFRGLKSLWSAPILMAGIALQHNFIESHGAIRAVPSELAQIKILSKPNRWMELIALCSKV